MRSFFEHCADIHAYLSQNSWQMLCFCYCGLVCFNQKDELQKLDEGWILEVANAAMICLKIRT